VVTLSPRRVLGALVLALAGCADEPGPRRPDVFLVVVDTLRADALLDPEGKYDTPHLDRLASEGLVFTQAFAHAPMTLPAHTALFSSRPPVETTVWNNGEDVPADLPLLAEWLRQHGYGTRAVVSIGTLNLGRREGLKRGFDHYDTAFWRIDRGERVLERIGEQMATLEHDRPQFFFAHFSDPHEPYDAHGSVRHVAELTLGGAALDKVSTSESEIWTRSLELAPGENVFELTSRYPFQVRALEVRERNSDLPVVFETLQRLEIGRQARMVVTRAAGEPAECLVRLWVNDAPARDEFARRYVLEVEHVDGMVGRFLDGLRAAGRYDDALIVFTSDHGEALGERDHFGHQADVNDPQVQVPLIVKLPRGDTRAAALARWSALPLGHIDLVPTLLELLALPPLPGARGRSLLAETGVAEVILQTHPPEAAQDMFALRDERFKLVYFPKEQRFQLFDLSQDPREEHDVYATRAGERPAWPARLEALARLGSELRQGGGEIDPEKAAELEALGYGGGG